MLRLRPTMAVSEEAAAAWAAANGTEGWREGTHIMVKSLWPLSAFTRSYRQSEPLSRVMYVTKKQQSYSRTNMC